MLSRLFKWGLFLLFCVGSVVFLTKQPLFVIDDISVSIVNKHKMYQDIPSRVEAKLVPFLGKSFFDLSLSEVVQLAEGDQRIKEAHVFRRLPGRLSVELVLKQPYAVLVDNKTRMIPVARDGGLLPPLKQGEFVDLPLLRGATLEKDQSKRKELVDFLTSIPSEGLFSPFSISEVWFTKRGGFTFFVGPAAAEIFLGHSLDEKKVEDINKVLKYMESKQLSGRIIDARFSKKVVVRLRNEN